MPITLVITVRKEVADQQEAEEIYNTVKTRLEDKPELKLTGHCANHFAPSE